MRSNQELANAVDPDHYHLKPAGGEFRDQTGIEPETVLARICDLPRLVYLGDVAVCDHGSGQKLLKALLETYPADRLRIMVSDFWRGASLGGDGIPGITAEYFPTRWRKFDYGRLYGWMTTHCLLLSGRRAKTLARRLKSFQPEGILTVTAGPSWLAAARLARLLNIPLHLILHDDLWTGLATAPAFEPWVHRQFAAAYQEAFSRFCVSPNMEEYYRSIFHVPGIVLYPNRSTYDVPNPTSDASVRAGKPFTVAYAGNTTSSNVVELLAILSKALDPIEGKLLVYELDKTSEEHCAPLMRQNVILRQRISPDELRRTLPFDADLLFVPMSFAPSDRRNAEISFPSKMVEYTATGLPMLICGPPYCSAVRWAREHPNAAICVETPDVTAVTNEIYRLAAEPDRRRQLGAAAAAAGNICFSYASAAEIFHGSLRRSIANGSLRLSRTARTIHARTPSQSFL